MSILLVEDDLDLAATVTEYLNDSGFIVDHAFHGESALNLASQREYDIIILDVMLPRLNGFEVCQRLRNEQVYQGPILFLTAMDTLDFKIQGFNSGCDDYLVKPFELPELECRLHALSKRGRRMDSRNIIFGELVINAGEKRVFRNDQEIALNKNQFNLLCELVKQAPNPVSRESLSQIIWQDEEPDSDSLRSHIYRLRNLIDKPFDFNMIETVHRIGLRIRDHV